MNENKKRDPIPEFNTLEEIAEFWDTHSTADYLDLTEEVEFEVNLCKERKLVAIMPELFEKLEAHAKARNVSVETLVNLWLAERVQA